MRLYIFITSFLCCIVDGPPPRQSYKHVKAKDALGSLKWRELSNDIKDMLNKRRVDNMQRGREYNLIDSACSSSIKTYLTQGDPYEAATKLIDYFEENHDGDTLLKFCEFLRDEAKEAGEAPRLKDLADKVERAVKAKRSSGVIALIVGFTTPSYYDCQKKYTHARLHNSHTHTTPAMSVLSFKY